MRTDGVHCREPAGTGPVNLKVVPNGCCLGRCTMTQLICASLSHTHYWYEVGMLKVPAATAYNMGLYLVCSIYYSTILFCLLLLICFFVVKQILNTQGLERKMFKLQIMMKKKYGSHEMYYKLGQLYFFKKKFYLNQFYYFAKR